MQARLVAGFFSFPNGYRQFVYIIFNAEAPPPGCAALERPYKLAALPLAGSLKTHSIESDLPAQVAIFTSRRDHPVSH